jgi:Tfp pilus assembly protein PilO
MNEVREYRIPLLMAAGTLVVALLLWAVLISPQNSKLSSLQTQETTLQTQQTTLEAKLASLKTEQQKLSSSCADLQKIATQIPSVQSPTDVDAEESSFESQFNALTATSGVTLTQFSGFAPATTAQATTPASGTGASTGSTTPADVTAVPTTLSVFGTYGQIESFINSLDTFPRLFVIQTFVLSYGAAASTTPGSSSTSSSSSASAAPSSGQSPLWTGGTATPAAAGPYTLAINGSIYYTSTPSALDACTKATAAVH